MNDLPRWVWFPFALGLGLLVVPLLGMLARVPWGALPTLLTSRRALDALGLSLVTCLAATAIVALLGIPLALVLARSEGRWVQIARTFVTVPMVLPPVVAGLALLSTFGRRGLVGQPLAELWGINIGFSTVAVIMAQTFVALPFLVTAMEGALRTSGRAHERVAANLGASPSQVFWKVTLPTVMPAVASGTALAFARALGEFGATLTFAGSLQGVTRTLPLEIYLLRETDTDLALALALVLILVAVLIVGVSGALQRWRQHG